MSAARRTIRKAILDLARLLGVGLALILPAGCGGGSGDDCEGKAYYGPPPCQTDQQCIDANGANWYCDEEHVVDEACGITWPTCVERK